MNNPTPADQLPVRTSHSPNASTTHRRGAEQRRKKPPEHACPHLPCQEKFTTAYRLRSERLSTSCRHFFPLTTYIQRTATDFTLHRRTRSASRVVLGASTPHTMQQTCRVIEKNAWHASVKARRPTPALRGEPVVSLQTRTRFPSLFFSFSGLFKALFNISLSLLFTLSLSAIVSCMLSLSI